MRHSTIKYHVVMGSPGNPRVVNKIEERTHNNMVKIYKRNILIQRGRTLYQQFSIKITYFHVLCMLT